MPKQILLADDSNTIARMVQITFAHEDYAVQVVKSADDALARARSDKPDVLLLDANLAGKSGYDVCQALRDAGVKDVPVLLLTGNFAPYDEARGQKAGVDGSIVKPFDTQALIDRVGQLIAAKGARSTAQGLPVSPSVARAAAPPTPTPAPTPPRPTESPLGAAAAAATPPAAEPPKPPTPAPVPHPLSPAAIANAPQRQQPRATLMGIPQIRPEDGSGSTPIAVPPSAPTPAAPTPTPPPTTTAPIRPSIPMPGSGRSPTGEMRAVNSAALGVGSSPTPTPPPRPTPAPMPVTPAPSTQGFAGSEDRTLISMDAPKIPPTLLEQKPAAPTPPAPRPITSPSVAAVPTAAPPSISPPGGHVAAPVAAAPSAGIPATAPKMPRQPLITGVGIPKPSSAVQAILDQAAAKGAEYAAIANLSREVLEQIAWEIVPQLAEVILKEHVDRLKSGPQ